MTLSHKHSGTLIDIMGASLLMGLLCAIMSMTMLRHDTIGDEIQELTQSIAQSSQQLALLKTRLEQSRHQALINRDLLTQRGRLPDTAPVEEYFQFLSERAEQLGLRVLSQYPTGERHYPGLRERRFAYAVSGSLPHIVQFFQAVESSDYWADIGYLKIQPPRATRGTQTEDREAQLTVCLFSADADASTKKDEG